MYPELTPGTRNMKVALVLLCLVVAASAKTISEINSELSKEKSYIYRLI